MKKEEPVKRKEKEPNFQENTFTNAYLHHLRIHQNRIETEQAYKDNDLQRWFKGLRVGFSHIVFKLTPEEEKQLLDYIEQVRTLVKENKREEATLLLHQIDILQMKLLHKYQLIFPKFELRTGIDKIESRYNDVNFDDL